MLCSGHGVWEGRALVRLVPRPLTGPHSRAARAAAPLCSLGTGCCKVTGGARGESMCTGKKRKTDKKSLVQIEGINVLTNKSQTKFLFLKNHTRSVVMGGTLQKDDFLRQMSEATLTKHF